MKNIDSKNSKKLGVPTVLQKILFDLDLYFFNTKYHYNCKLFPVPFIRKLITPLRSSIIGKSIAKDREFFKNELENHIELSEVFHDYCKKTDSTGVGINDYLRLYLFVRVLKPKYVLECGTGTSTTALAMALKHNFEEDGIEGKCISMEEIDKWHEQAVKNLPEILSPFVEIKRSDRIEKTVNGLAGVCYKDLPELPFEFAFIDGPNPVSPVSGKDLFDIDFANVVLNNSSACGVIDHRLTTVRGLGKVLKCSHSVVYNPVSKFGYLIPKA